MSHAYDNAFRTMEMDCPKLLIPVVNEAFKKNYPLDANVLMYPNEQMITTPNDEEIVRITDSNFMIIENQNERYHIECESNPDNGELLVRLYQYDMQIAMSNRRFIDGVMHVMLPKTAVLYLRSNENSPNRLKMIIEDGSQKIIRAIPIIKIQSYSLEEIFEKRLLFFLPFHVFIHEKMLSLYNKDENRRKILLNEYKNIIDFLDELHKLGEIDSVEKYCIITSMREVLSLIAKGKNNLVKEADSIMGGEILEYEAKTIYRDGINEGIKQGKDAIDELLQSLISSGKISVEEAKNEAEKAKSKLS